MTAAAAIMPLYSAANCCNCSALKLRPPPCAHGTHETARVSITQHMHMQAPTKRHHTPHDATTTRPKSKRTANLSRVVVRRLVLRRQTERAARWVHHAARVRTAAVVVGGAGLLRWTILLHVLWLRLVLLLIVCGLRRLR